MTGMSGTDEDPKKTRALPGRVYNAVYNTELVYAPPLAHHADAAQTALELRLEYMRVDRLIMSYKTFYILDTAVGNHTYRTGWGDPRVDPVTVFGAKVVIDDRLPPYTFEVAMAVSYDA